MEEKMFLKEKRKMSYLVFVIIVSLCSGFFGSAFYNLMNNKTLEKSNNASENTVVQDRKYEISQVENPVIAIAKEVSPSIVGVKVEYITQGMLGLLQDSGSEGSGIIYSEDGYIITNYHVISAALSNSSATVSVVLPETHESIPATIVGGDKVTDLAVIKIDKSGVKKAKFGTSKDVQVGELAVAIGNPLGQELASTLTGGYISAVNRKLTTEGKTYNLLQTDAAINPGNSGGALLNSKGEVIGINTIKISVSGVEGLGFAIPIDDALPIIKELIENKKISRPYIGISGFNLDKTTADKYKLIEGVYVSDVSSGTPAMKSSVKKADIITQIDDKKITTMEELNEYKNTKKVGDTITLKIYRQKAYIDIKIVLEEDIDVE